MAADKGIKSRSEEIELLIGGVESISFQVSP